MNTPTGAFANLRGSLAQRRADRTERLQLERELAAYVTPADQTELRAMLARHTTEESAEIRQILDRQLVTHKMFTYPGTKYVA